MNKLILSFLVLLFSLSWVAASAQVIGIFIDTQVSQSVFAANDVKAAFERKGYTVELLSLAKLSKSYKNQKVVLIATSDNKTVRMLKESGGTKIPALGGQSFAIQTIMEPVKAYWVIGGDSNGVMYGGLQLAENIDLVGVDGIFNEVQSPDILNRGIKFNVPFDKRSPTYYSSGFSENDFRGTSSKIAVEHIWDLDFWSSMFDELARHRYNAISLWSLHPFTSMIKLPDYPEVAIQDVEGFNGFSKKMSIDEKIEFWKAVMQLAKNRGFDFYIYNWNIYTYGATGKYGIDNDPKNPQTIAYMRACMTKLLETYPDLKGFGITAGENMVPLNNEEEAKWTWATYGQGVLDFASAHPERKIVFIHRYHDAGGAEVAENFKPLLDLPNVRFDFSFKYAVAHIYSTPTPEWIRTRNGDVPAQLIGLNLKTWIELRNDSFYYLHWGDPDFVKAYLNGIPEKERTFQGFFMGADGLTPTYDFISKADWPKGKLEMQRLWYTWMLWGRLSYNPNLTDSFFENVLAFRYPQVESKELFSAWSEASKGLPLFTETIQGTLISDFKWYPETCMSRPNGFVTISQMIEAVPPPGSNTCSVANSATKNCSNKKSTYQVADEIEAHGQKALNEIGNLEIDLSTELGTNIANIKTMSYLSLYFAEKLRGATYLEAKQTEAAKDAMGEAYQYWIQYSKLMDDLYIGQDLQRTRTITTWKALDEDVLAEYTNLGGRLEQLNTLKK